MSTRWADGDEEAVKTYLALLLSFGCPVTLYQGDEFGMEEADVPFEKLQDPYGKAFWPEFKGRDGCRIPMSWTAKAPYAGFSSSEPWLPVAAEYAAKNAENDGGDCVLAFLKKMIAWRKSENFQGAPLISNIGGLLRIRWKNQNGDTFECVFNLSSEPLEYPYEDENVVMASSGEVGRVLGGKRFRIRRLDR